MARATIKSPLSEADFSRRDPRDAETVIQLTALLTSAGFTVERPRRLGLMTPIDLLAKRKELGRERVFAIRVSFGLDIEQTRATAFNLDAQRVRKSSGSGGDFDEHWTVTDPKTSRAASRGLGLSKINRILSLDQIASLLALQGPKNASGTPQTTIGKAIFANRDAINLAISGLILHIDDKLDALRRELPNSGDAIALRDSRISAFESARAELENIRTLVAAFTEGHAKEADVVQSVTTFRDGLRDWWRKGHEAIISKTFDTGLFLSSVGVLTLMNADMKTGMVVSGTLIARKSIAGGMKGLKKKLFGD